MGSRGTEATHSGRISISQKALGLQAGKTPLSQRVLHLRTGSYHHPQPAKIPKRWPCARKEQQGSHPRVAHSPPRGAHTSVLPGHNAPHATRTTRHRTPLALTCPGQSRDQRRLCSWAAPGRSAAPRDRRAPAATAPGPASPPDCGPATAAPPSCGGTCASVSSRPPRRGSPGRGGGGRSPPGPWGGGTTSCEGAGAWSSRTRSLTAGGSRAGGRSTEDKGRRRRRRRNPGESRRGAISPSPAGREGFCRRPGPRRQRAEEVPPRPPHQPVAPA